MEAALLGIAVLLGLLVLVLAVPINLGLWMAGTEPLTGQVSVRWFFGLVRFRLGLPRPTKARRRGTRRTRGAAGTSARRRKPGRSADVLAVLRQSAFRRRLYRLARDVGRAVHPHGLHLRLRLGLGDPADTGRLWGLLGPLSALARSVENADVRIEPDFTDAALDFEARGRFVLIPLRLMGLAIAFLLSPSTIRAWRTLRAGRA